MKHLRRWAAVAVLIFMMGLLCTAPANAVKLVAITFDDGPNEEWTPKFVEALNQRGVKGTFFMVGSWIPTKEGMVQDMMAQGHQIANHTWEHANLSNMTAEEVRTQIEQSRAKLEAVTGKSSFLVRTPFGVRTQTVKDCLDGPLTLWSQDPAAGQTVSGDVMAKKVIRTIRDGDIILLHDSTQNNLDAACQIIDALQPKGYDFVTIDELLRLRGVTPPAGSVLKRVPAGNDTQSYDESRLSEHWAWPSIQTVMAQGIITGDEEGFHPNRSLSRAEAVEILWRAAGHPQASQTTSYLDVKSNAPYAEAVAWAKESGLLNGIVKGLFCPGTTVTREQLYVLVDRVLAMDFQEEPAELVPLPSYEDRFRISEWARPAVEHLEHLGFSSVNDRELLRPGDAATRAEAAELVAWYLMQE